MDGIGLTVRVTGSLPKKKEKKKEPGEESGEYTRNKVLQSAVHTIIRRKHLPSFWTGIELANVATYVKSLHESHALGLRAEARHILFVLISPFTNVSLALDNLCRRCLYILFPRMSRVRTACKASYFPTCLQFWLVERDCSFGCLLLRRNHQHRFRLKFTSHLTP